MALRAGCSFCLFAHSCLEGYTEGGGNKWARFKWKHHCQVTKNRPKQCTRAGPGQRAIHQGHRALCAMCYPAFQGSTPNVPPSTSGQCIQCVTHQGQHTQLATQHLRTWSNEPLTGAITISTFPVIQGERPKGQADSSLKINLLDSGWGVCRGAESKQTHKKRHVFHAPLSPILTLLLQCYVLSLHTGVVILKQESSKANYIILATSWQQTTGCRGHSDLETKPAQGCLPHSFWKCESQHFVYLTFCCSKSFLPTYILRCAEFK